MVEEEEAEMKKPGLRMRTERIRRGRFGRRNGGRTGWLLNLPRR